MGGCSQRTGSIERLYSLENERFKIAFKVLKGQRELPCMPPEGRAGTRRGQSLLRHRLVWF